MKNLIPLTTLFFCLSTCSGMNVIGEMMMDAGNGNAQTSNKVLTADTDASRFDGGIVPMSMSLAKEIATGPLVVTALSEGELSNGIYVWVADMGTACDAGASRFRAAGLSGIFLKTGQKLCAAGSAFGGGSTALFWSGYRPY